MRSYSVSVSVSVGVSNLCISAWVCAIDCRGDGDHVVGCGVSRDQM